MKGKLSKTLILVLVVTQLVLATGSVAHASSPCSYYTVQRGDTLYSIARRYGSTVQAIAQASGILNPSRIYVGQVLCIPSGWVPPVATGGYYIVQRGDTLYSIAVRHGTSVWAIVMANNISNPSLIHPGQALLIPGLVVLPSPPPPPPPPPAPTPTPTPTPTPIPQVAVCLSKANITYPTVDAKLNGWGTTFIQGTAAIDNFWFYKLEFGSGQLPAAWSVIKELHYQPVVNGILGDWNTGALPEGVYQLRLVVVDKTGNYPTPCQVRVIIER